MSKKKKNRKQRGQRDVGGNRHSKPEASREGTPELRVIRGGQKVELPEDGHLDSGKKPTKAPRGYSSRKKEKPENAGELGHVRASTYVPKYARKVKVKKVLDPAAKRFVRRVAIIVVALIVAALIGVTAVNMFVAKKAADEQAVSAEDAVVSLVGLTPAGKQLVEFAGTFSGFLEDDKGRGYALAYDTDITAADASLLDENGQLTASGEIAYVERD